MNLKDCRGLELSARNPDSVERLEQAIDLTVSYFLDPLATINGALERRPGLRDGPLPARGAGCDVDRARRPAADPRERRAASRRWVAGPTTASGPMRRRRARWLEGDLAGGMRALRRHRHRPSARLACAADRARRRFLPRPVDDAARPRRAGAAALGRLGARLWLRARHARVRAGGNGSLRPCRGRGPQGAGDQPPRPLGRARRRARDGDAGPHPRRHRLPGSRAAGLVDRQRARVPQLVAPRAASPRLSASTTARSSSTTPGSARPRPPSRSRWSTRRRCSGGSRCAASTSARAGSRWPIPGSRSRRTASTRSTTPMR